MCNSPMESTFNNRPPSVFYLIVNPQNFNRNVADRNPKYRDRLGIADLDAMYLVQRLRLRFKPLLHSHHPMLCCNGDIMV